MQFFHPWKDRRQLQLFTKQEVARLETTYNGVKPKQSRMYFYPEVKDVLRKVAKDIDVPPFQIVNLAVIDYLTTAGWLDV